jgi:hypothetical protein
VDWTEVTDSRQGATVAAKLHGGFAWEASPDFWSTHPMGGKVDGLLWVTCIAANGSIDSGCVSLLGESLASAGTSTPVLFSGTYYDPDAKRVLRPIGLFDADASAHPVFYAEVGLGSHGPINPNVCPAAFALGNDGDAGGLLPSTPAKDAGAATPPARSEPGAVAGSGAASTPQAPAGPAAAGPPGSMPSSAATDPARARSPSVVSSGQTGRGSCSTSISDRRRQGTSALAALALGLVSALAVRRRTRMHRRCRD